MKYIFTHKNQITIASASFLLLFVHDSNLYPHLSIAHRLVLSLLRSSLLVLPITAAFLITASTSHRVKLTMGILLVALLPYTLYSVTEIRHIAEICTLQSGTYYTDSCATDSWKLLPPLAYALLGIAAYCISLSWAKIQAMSWRLMLLVAYCAAACQFALQSRLNMWDIVVQPKATLSEVQETITTLSFWGNALLFFLFFAFITICYTRFCKSSSSRLGGGNAVGN